MTDPTKPNGKGSTQRPVLNVPTWNSEFERIFGKKPLNIDPTHNETVISSSDDSGTK